MQRVQQSNSSTLLLEGIQNCDPDELQSWLFQGSIPPGGNKDYHRLQTISRKDTDEAIGYLSVYHGYPDAGTLYIGSLSIRQDCQNKGFGGEIVDKLRFLEGSKAYPTHRLVVTVRNWGAIKFWTRHGFTNIVNVIGDLHAEGGSSARLELVRSE